MKGALSIICLLVMTGGYAQINCEDETDYKNGKEWAIYQLHPDDSLEINRPKQTVSYFVCDPDAFMLPRKEFEIYCELLQEDNFGVLNCQSDMWSFCYEQGFKFVVDSVLSTRKIPKNYFKRKKKKAKRLARKAERT